MVRHATGGTDLENGATFDREDGARWGFPVRFQRTSACWHAARHAVQRGVSSDSICVVTSRGADGPARRSGFVSRASATGPPPIHSPRTAAGHHRMTRSSRRSPTLGAACGSWTRAWGRREPALQGTGRLNKKARHDRRAGSRVGWTSRPHTPTDAHFASDTRSGRGRAALIHAPVESESLSFMR